MVDVGEKAPDFTLPSDSRDNVSLSDFRGKKVVLYFYLRTEQPDAPVRLRSLETYLKSSKKENAVILGSAKIV